MQGCQFASQFCCGFSVEFGVGFILGLHLLRNVCCVASTALAVTGYVEYDPLGVGRGTEIIECAVALAGLPLIGLGFWGLRESCETSLRLYWWFLLVGFVIDELLAAGVMVERGFCGRSRADGGTPLAGQAFACGAERGLDALALVTLTGVELYLIYVVGSYCEALKADGGMGPSFASLCHEQADRKKQDHILRTYTGVGEPLRCSLSGYGALAGHADGHPLFGGTRHCLDYPPVKGLPQ